MQEILEMSVAERILMIEKIWDSIDHNTIDTSSAYKLELDYRLDRYAKGETTFVSWEDVKKELTNANG